MRLSNATAIVAILPLFGMAAAPANAADIGETGDPHIDQQLRNELRWSGFYAGIAGTIGMTNTALDADFPDYPGPAFIGAVEGFGPFGLGDASLDGIGSEGAGLTGVVGYDQRFGRFVAGAFADFTYSDDFWKTEASLGSASAEINREHDWTAGARLGVLVNPATMVYGLAGYSQMKMSAEDAGSITFDGYTVGAGLESKVNDFMSWYVEGRWSEYEDEAIVDEEDFTVTAEPSEVKAMMGLKLRLLTE